MSVACCPNCLFVAHRHSEHVRNIPFHKFLYFPLGVILIIFDRLHKIQLPYTATQPMNMRSAERHERLERL